MGTMIVSDSLPDFHYIGQRKPSSSKAASEVTVHLDTFVSVLKGLTWLKHWAVGKEGKKGGGREEGGHPK